MVDGKKQAEQYIQQQNDKLNRIKREWKQETDDADSRLVSAVMSGLRFDTNRSQRYDADSSFRYSSASFQPTINTNNADEFMTALTGRITGMIDSVIESVKDINKNLGGFCSAGLDASMMQQVIALLLNWVDFLKSMKFTLRGREVTANVPDEIVAIENKWKYDSKDGRPMQASLWPFVRTAHLKLAC